MTPLNLQKHTGPGNFAESANGSNGRCQQSRKIHAQRAGKCRKKCRRHHNLHCQRCPNKHPVRSKPGATGAKRRGVNLGKFARASDRLYRNRQPDVRNHLGLKQNILIQSGGSLYKVVMSSAPDCLSIAPQPIT